MTKFSNGFYRFSDSYLRSMNKKDLICHIRTIEKNWENALITNDIQYHDCKRLLEEERNKAIDEFVKKCKSHIFCKTFGLKLNNIEEIAEEMKAGGENG